MFRTLLVVATKNEKDVSLSHHKLFSALFTTIRHCNNCWGTLILYYQYAYLSWVISSVHGQLFEISWSV